MAIAAWRKERIAVRDRYEDSYYDPDKRAVVKNILIGGFPCAGLVLSMRGNEEEAWVSAARRIPVGE